ncbi:hypothetical protein [Azospirillum sp. sgz302134]
MTNGDVLWAWVAGILVSLVVLVVQPRLHDPGHPSAYDGSFMLPEATLGAGQWDLEQWERTGGTPMRAGSDDRLYGTLDLMERIVPVRELHDGNEAVAEQPQPPPRPEPQPMEPLLNGP